MRRMAILLVLSLPMSVTVSPPRVALSDNCTFSVQPYWDQYQGCFCDMELTHKCIGSGYVYYLYECDSPCPQCQSCHYVGHIPEAVITEMYPVCYNLHGLQFCEDDTDCDLASWHADWEWAPLCTCW